MYQRILVPVEGEGGSEAHLRHAAELAKDEDAELTLLRVITVIPSDEYVLQRIQVEAGSRGAKDKEKSEAYVSRLAQELEQEGVRVRREVVISDKPEDETIVAHADENGEDLIVLPRPSRSLFSRWLQGNVTGKVQRRATVPVMTVREEKE